VLILGRVTSGEGGDVILTGAEAVLKTEFPELAGTEMTAFAFSFPETEMALGASSNPARTNAVPSPGERLG
jgi:hypothetical protein